MRVSLAEAKTQLSKLLRETEQKNIVITSHNQPKAILVDYENFYKMIEYIEDLEDENTVLRHELNPAEPRITLEALEKELGL